jgi:hypothetical protein
MRIAEVSRMTIRNSVLIFAAICCAASGLSAQEPVCPAARPAADSVKAQKPDIVIKGKVTAREVRFESQPEVSVQWRGCPGLDTTRVSVRTNLPKPVQPGVTYRNVELDFQVSGWLREIDCAIGRALDARQRQNLRVATPDSVIRNLLQSCPATDSIRRN